MLYDFSSNSKEYERALGKSHKYFIQLKCRELLKVLSKFGYKPRRVLDLGCGTGEAEEVLCRYFDEMVGIDASEGMINEAKRKNLPNSEFKQADVLNLPFPDRSFDLVFSFCLFHHLPEDRREHAMKEAARVGKKSAVLLTFEHNPRNPITQYVVSKSSIDEGVVLISAKRMEELYMNAGLKIIRKGFIIFFPKLLSFLLPLESLLYKIPCGGQYYIAGLSKESSEFTK